MEGEGNVEGEREREHPSLFARLSSRLSLTVELPTGGGPVDRRWRGGQGDREDKELGKGGHQKSERVSVFFRS